jgi:hypothetical protein
MVSSAGNTVTISSEGGHNQRFIGMPYVKESDVDVDENTITIQNHGFETGHKVIYKEGNVNLGPLKHNEVYSVVLVDSNKFKLRSVEATTGTITLTTKGGMNQKFIRVPDCTVARKGFESDDNTYTNFNLDDVQYLVSSDSYAFDVFSIALDQKVEKDSTIRIQCSDTDNVHQYALQPNRLFGRCMGNTIDYNTNMHFNMKKTEFTVNTANVFTKSSHGLQAGTKVMYFKGTDNVVGLRNRHIYYIRNVNTDTFQVSKTISGHYVRVSTISAGAGYFLSGGFNYKLGTDKEYTKAIVSNTAHTITNPSTLTINDKYGSIDPTSLTSTFSHPGKTMSIELRLEEGTNGFFDDDTKFTAANVKADDETITLSSSSTLSVGDVLVYRAVKDLCSIGGLYDKSLYYIMEKNGNTIKLSTSENGAVVDLLTTRTSSNNNCFFIQQPSCTVRRKNFGDEQDSGYSNVAVEKSIASGTSLTIYLSASAGIKSTLEVKCTNEDKYLKLRTNKRYDPTDKDVFYSIWVDDGEWLGPVQVVPPTKGYTILNPTTLSVDNANGHMAPRKLTLTVYHNAIMAKDFKIELTPADATYAFFFHH